MKKHLYILTAFLFLALVSVQAQEKTNTPAETDCKLIAPNAFTPNYDGVNDLFNLSISADCEYINYNFEVYDRWGRLVFESDEVTEGWDGTYDGQELKEGVYLWQASLVWMAETGKKGGQTETKKGTLVLIR